MEDSNEETQSTSVRAPSPTDQSVALEDKDVQLEYHSNSDLDAGMNRSAPPSSPAANSLAANETEDTTMSTEDDVPRVATTPESEESTYTRAVSNEATTLPTSTETPKVTENDSGSSRGTEMGSSSDLTKVVPPVDSSSWGEPLSLGKHSGTADKETATQEDSWGNSAILQDLVGKRTSEGDGNEGNTNDNDRDGRPRDSGWASQRPSGSGFRGSFGNEASKGGFGSAFGSNTGGSFGRSFASGPSGDRPPRPRWAAGPPTLPPLGTRPIHSSPNKADRFSRREQAAPYSSEGHGHRTSRSITTYDVNGLGSGPPFGEPSNEVKEHSRPVRGEREARISLDLLAKLKSGDDHLLNKIMGHLSTLQQYAVDSTHCAIDAAYRETRYKEKKRRHAIELQNEQDPIKRAVLDNEWAMELESFRTEADAIKRRASVADRGRQLEMNGLIRTIGQGLSDKIHDCILEVVRALQLSTVGGAGGSEGSSSSIAAVVERCVMFALPLQTHSLLEAKETKQRELEERIRKLEAAVQSKADALASIERRLNGLENKQNGALAVAQRHMLSIEKQQDNVLANVPMVTDSINEPYPPQQPEKDSSLSTCAHQ